jgi:hypothetical protein
MTRHADRHWRPRVRSSPETIQTAQTPIGRVRSPATRRTTASGHHCILSVACVTLRQQRPDAPSTRQVTTMPSVWSLADACAFTAKHYRTCRSRVRSCSRSLFLSEKHLIHFTNFTTLTQMCQPPSVSPCARVLAYFHKHFQGC